MHDGSRRVPASRVAVAKDVPPRVDGDYVLYWMRATRRMHDNFALDRAVELARELARPLLVFEALSCDYPWASDRHHDFILAGMNDNARACTRVGVRYYPYVEPSSGHARGLLAALAAGACAIITDDHPGFHFPAMLEAAVHMIDTRLEAVDSLGLMPMRAAPRRFPTALGFRAFLQDRLPEQLGAMPSPTPLRGFDLPRARVPREVLQRWPAASLRLLHGDRGALAKLPIDHSVPPTALRGGAVAGLCRLRRFVEEHIEHYGDSRDHPDANVVSGLSPYLHHGHVGIHGVLRQIAGRFDWSPGELGRPRRGARAGFWGLPPAVEAFMDQVVVWRELGHNFAAFGREPQGIASLPTWAARTLRAHEGDPRPKIYTREALESADTHDELWNAAQRQLLQEGRIHNYLRMLWGKHVLQWTSSPDEALMTLLELNNRWALDGRDPNSDAGIYWVLGRYDRPWGPERPIFGTVRYMSSRAARRKLHLKRYLLHYAGSREEPQ